MCAFLASRLAPASEASCYWLCSVLLCFCNCLLHVQRGVPQNVFYFSPMEEDGCSFLLKGWICRWATSGIVKDSVVWFLLKLFQTFYIILSILVQYHQAPGEHF